MITIENNMDGQLSVFDFYIDFCGYIVTALKAYCEKWGYDWLQKIEEKKTVETFYRNVCKLTKYHFFNVESDMYGIEYSKDGTGRIYKCGKHSETTIEVIDINNILERL